MSAIGYSSAGGRAGRGLNGQLVADRVVQEDNQVAKREPELDSAVEYLRAIALALMGVNARVDKIIELLGGRAG